MSERASRTAPSSERHVSSPTLPLRVSVRLPPLPSPPLPSPPDHPLQIFHSGSDAACQTVVPTSQASATVVTGRVLCASLCSDRETVFQFKHANYGARTLPP